MWLSKCGACVTYFMIIATIFVLYDNCHNIYSHVHLEYIARASAMCQHCCDVNEP